MGIARTSSAADCMNILSNSRQKKNEENDFASMLNQSLNGGSLIRDTPTGDLIGTVKRELYIPKTTFTEYSRSPYSERTCWRQERDYDAFLKDFENSKVEYTEDMWDTDSNGKRSINKKGIDHFSQWRMDRLDQMTPDNTEEAEQKFKAGWEHLNNYMHTMFDDWNIEYDFNYQPQAVPGSPTTGILYGTNTIGMSDYESNSERLRNFLKSDTGKTMEVMVEEVQFYGAISELASVNSDFRNAYNEDSESALAKYASDISATMNSIRMPKVQTSSNLYRQLLQYGGS